MPDPFDRATDFFTALVADLTAPQADVLTHDELEELPDARGREILRQLLQDHLDLRALREEKAARTRPRPRIGADQLPARGWNTATGGPWPLFGTVTVRRCTWRAPGLSSYHPADVSLSLPQNLCTAMGWRGWPRSRPCGAPSTLRARPSPAGAGR
ncbi:hypothetical protein [Streptomyces syringium]|uniref:hypothetical protein n=1 Tax=Streptomyces syringium TaxID=76729 RepID=UPI003452D53C